MRPWTSNTFRIILFEQVHRVGLSMFQLERCHVGLGLPPRKKKSNVRCLPKIDSFLQRVICLPKQHTLGIYIYYKIHHQPQHPTLSLSFIHFSWFSISIQNQFFFFLFSFSQLNLFLPNMENFLGLLRVNVLRGINLAKRDTRSSDPYIIVKMDNQVNKRFFNSLVISFNFSEFSQNC